MSKFNYNAYFGPILPLADALRQSPERFWEATPAKLAQPHDYVLFLGCNVLRTMNLAEAMVAVLGAMKVDFITLGGAGNCCGIVHHVVGDDKAAKGIAQRTLDKFARVQPKAVLTYCPSCNVFFDEQIGSGALAFGLPYLHVTQFIAENLDRLAFKTPIRRRIGLHCHQGTALSRNDSKHTLAILRAIPGLDVVELPADEEWGYICSPSIIAKIGTERHRAMVAETVAKAKALGCDGLATVYHTCYRELLWAEGEHGIEWLNYVELLAEALGLGPFPPLYKRFVQAGDPEAAYAALAGRIAERGGDPDGLKRAVHAHFEPGASPVSLDKP